MQKKVLLGLVLSGLALAMVLPWPVLANGELPEQLPQKCTIRRSTGIEGCPEAGQECDFDDPNTPNCGVCCVISTIYYAADWAFIFAMLIVVIFTIWGAFEILTSSGGDTPQFKRGQNRILYAVIGFAIAIFSRAVPAIVKFMIRPGA